MTSDEETQYVDVNGKRLRVSHLSKVIFPDDGITKAQLLQYYHDVSEFMLPHIRGRPLTIKAYPLGISERPYHRRKLGAGAPAWLPRVELEEGPGPYVEDLADLMWLINQDSVDVHPWLSRYDDLDHPDHVIFDLDPGPGVPYSRVCEGANEVRRALEQMGMECWVKSSGSKGLHIISGIEREYEFDDVRNWVIAVSRVLAQHRPDLFTIGYSRSDRVGKVLLDYNQVGFGRTTAALYSVRPVRGAWVSAPLTWEEVEDGKVLPEHFHIWNMVDRVKALGDVAAGLAKASHRLPHL